MIPLLGKTHDARLSPSLAIRWRMLVGLRTWAAFGAIELLWLAVLPRLSTPAYEYAPVHAGVSAAFLFGYAVLGALIGSAAGIFFHAPDKLQAFMTLTVIWAFCANAIIFLPDRGGQLVYLILALAYSAGVVIAEKCRRLEWLAFLANPESASLLIVGTSAIAARRPGTGSGTWLLWETAYVVAVGLFSLLVGRRRAAGVTASWITPLASILSVLALTAIFDAAPLRARAVVPPAAHRPNVILVVLDTVRADHLSVYGYERDTTPNLRSFAREAVQFIEAISSDGMTLTSHASLFTGLYGLRHGAHPSLDAPGGRPLADEFETLAEILSRNGYETAAIVANTGYLRPFFNLHQGFRYYDVRGPRMRLEGCPRFFLRGGLSEAALWLLPDSDLSRWTRNAEEINRAAFEFLAMERERERPLFLFLNYMDAHRPYVAPPPFRDRFPGRDPRYGARHHRRLTREVMTGKRPISLSERNHLVSQYDGALAYLDAQLGQFIERLKAENLWENSLVIVTSDHGESLGERNLIEHGSAAVQSQLRVPLLIRYPAGPRAKIVSVRASAVDLLPTVLSAVGIEIPAGLDGRSLLDEESLSGRPVFAESYPTGITMALNRRYRLPERAVYEGRWKLIDSRLGRRELYDLLADPSETVDLYSVKPAIAEHLTRILAEWSARPAARRGQSPPLDPRTVERLRALGYLR
jgi:arylsulfatase A-like enzyme